MSYEYLRAMQKPYLQGNRKEKATILTHIEAGSGLNRKYLITYLSRLDLELHRHHRQHGRVYGPDVTQAVLVIAEGLV